jgi:hypothetical protein
MPAVNTALAPQARKAITCVDSANRGRQLTTYLAEARVVVLSPPGESALLEPMEARELAQHLLELAEQADQMHNDRRVIPFRGNRMSR